MFSCQQGTQLGTIWVRIIRCQQGGIREEAFPYHYSAKYIEDVCWKTEEEGDISTYESNVVFFSVLTFKPG